MVPSSNRCEDAGQSLNHRIPERRSRLLILQNLTSSMENSRAVPGPLEVMRCRLEPHGPPYSGFVILPSYPDNW
jgi:hypothetical protein